MSRKTDQFGNARHPGEAYRRYKASGLMKSVSWKKLQQEFKRKKRLRKISRLARKGKRPKNNMRPVLS